MEKENIVIKQLQGICIAIIPESLISTLYHSDLLCLEISFIYAIGVFIWKIATVNMFQWSVAGFFTLWFVWNFVLFLTLRCLDVHLAITKTPPVLLALLVGPLQMGTVHWLLPSYAPAGVLPYICMFPIGALQICLYIYFAHSPYSYGWNIDDSELIPGLIKWGFFVGVLIGLSKITISHVMVAVVLTIFLTIMESYVPKHFDYMDATKIAFNFWMSIIICSAGYGVFILLCPGISFRNIWGYVWYIIALMCVLEFRDMRRRID